MLVSCIVLAYNSAKTVIETLESIKNQTYKEIELIVSDDASTDDTVKICQEWIERNKERFVRTELITVNKNTGIAENCNRGFNAANGEWIKSIAADDILLRYGIKDFIDFINVNPDAMWISSFTDTYSETFDRVNCINKNCLVSRKFFEMTAEQQLRRISFENSLFAPSIIYRRSLFKEVGNYDSKYILEDWPYYVKILEHGYKCFLLEKSAVGYRMHKSLSNANDGSIFNYAFEKKTRTFQREKCWPNLTAKEIMIRQIWFLVQDLFNLFSINRNNGFWNRAYYRIYNKLSLFCGISR